MSSYAVTPADFEGATSEGLARLRHGLLSLDLSRTEDRVREWLSNLILVVDAAAEGRTDSPPSADPGDLTDPELDYLIQVFVGLRDGLASIEAGEESQAVSEHADAVNELLIRLSDLRKERYRRFRGLE